MCTAQSTTGMAHLVFLVLSSAKKAFISFLLLSVHVNSLKSVKKENKLY